MRGLCAATIAALAVIALPASAAAATGPTDLDVGISAQSSRVQPGDIANFDTGVGNNGPNDATGVTITVQLPAGLTFVPAMSDPACSGSGQTVTCHVGNLFNHAVTEPFRIAAQTSDSGSFIATASVSADQPDTDASNNSAAATVVVGQSAGPTDLQVGLSAESDRVQSGNVVYFDTGASNNGPNDATGVVITVELPDGLAFAPGMSDPSCSASGQTVTCQVGTLSNHAVTEPDRIAAQTSSFGTFTATATVSGDQPDTDPSNNSASATVTVSGPANVGVQIQGPAQVDVQTVNGYTFDVINGGPDGTSTTSLDITLPAQMALAGVSSSQGSCQGDASTIPNTIHCDLAAIPAAGSAQVTVQAYAYTDGSSSMTAMVASDRPDPNASNNSASLATTVVPVADVSVAGGPAVTPGKGHKSTITFTIVVYDGGPSTATSVTLSNTWSGTAKNIDLTSFTIDRGSCTHTGAALTCSIGTLQGGETATLTVTVTAQGPGTVTDTAVVSAATKDPDRSNNTGVFTASI